MKLLSFQKNGAVHVGASIDEGFLDLTQALQSTHPEVPSDSLLSIIQSGVDIDTIGEASINQLRSHGNLSRYLVSHFKWLPPILRPPKILALALNFEEHIRETNLAFYNEPITFVKYGCSMIAHGDQIVLPTFPQLVDEELEIAFVVGKDCRHILPSQSPDYIFGYTICNDVSARDRQRERARMGQPYSYAKNFETFCPIGPWIVTRKEIPDPHNLAMEVRNKGQVKRRGNSSQMIFNCYETLAYCSDYCLMEAGDVVSMGTFAGDKEIVPGDDIELEIEKIGVLRNPVVASKTQWRNFPTSERTGPMVKESVKT